MDLPRNNNGSPSASVSVSDVKGVVVLLHGLGSTSWLMILLAYRLRLRGYHVINWGYWSFRQSLGHLIPHFEQRFRNLTEELPPDTPLQIVAHSMGSIITRSALGGLELPALRRVVLLSPPNRGSYVASWLGPYLRWLVPLIDELADRTDSFVNRIEHHFQPDVQVGVIAAKWDYVLTEEATHLEEECDHIILPSRHSGLVLRGRVAEQIIHFLEHGLFLRGDAPEIAAMSQAVTEPAIPAN